MNNVLIRIAIVDDHQIVIDGLKSILQGHPIFKVCFETTDPLLVPELLKNETVDILLTDVMMPGLSGIDLAKQVHQDYPDIKILALSMNGEAVVVNQMIEESNISGYIMKNTGKQELLYAIEKIASGGIYFSQDVLNQVLEKPAIQKNEDETGLTRREIEIIRLIEKEKHNKEIAESLFISERTVETHRKNIFRKTKVNSLIGLVKYAYEHKLIER